MGAATRRGQEATAKRGDRTRKGARGGRTELGTLCAITPSSGRQRIRRPCSRCASKETAIVSRGPERLRDLGWLLTSHNWPASRHYRLDAFRALLASPGWQVYKPYPAGRHLARPLRAPRARMAKPTAWTLLLHLIVFDSVLRRGANAFTYHTSSCALRMCACVDACVALAALRPACLRDRHPLANRQRKAKCAPHSLFRSLLACSTRGSPARTLALCTSRPNL